MLLIVIYGPPASGKLTVARELALLTGYPVFHNHLVVDMLTPLFPFGSLPFVELREQVWLDVLTKAAAEGMEGVIITFTPEHTISSNFIGDLKKEMNVTGSQITFVKLQCPDEELERRMENRSRFDIGKLSSVDQYRLLKESGAFTFTTIPSTGLTIDTSKIQPDRAAERILNYIGKSQV